MSQDATGAMMGMSVPERRQALAGLALRAERANRPRVVVLLALVVLVAALGWVGTAWMRRASADEALERAASFAQRNVEAASDLRDLKARASRREGAGGADPVATLRSRLIDAADRAGIVSAQGLLPTRTRADRSPGSSVVLNRFEYEVRDPSLPNLLAWVASAPGEVPGLEVYRVSITPEQQSWLLRVEFARWERGEGP